MYSGLTFTHQDESPTSKFNSIKLNRDMGNITWENYLALIDQHAHTFSLYSPQLSHFDSLDILFVFETLKFSFEPRIVLVTFPMESRYRNYKHRMSFPTGLRNIIFLNGCRLQNGMCNNDTNKKSSYQIKSISLQLSFTLSASPFFHFLHSFTSSMSSEVA